MLKSYKTLLILLFYGFVFNSCKNKDHNVEILTTKGDSISIWVKNAKKTSLQVSERKQFLLKSYLQLKATETNVPELKMWSDIAYQELKLKDTFLFKKINKEGLKHALRLKDSFYIADIHWNYASYYNNNGVYDSAYYHFNIAQKYFVNNKDYVAKMLIGKAYIRSQFSDYIGSEIYIIKTIEIFKELEKYKELSNSYNSLAVIQYELQEYDRALYYFEKALEYSKKSKTNNLFSIYNNIGLTYQKKEEYNTAISYFKKDLDEQLRSKRPQEYARIIDNIANTKLLNKDTSGVQKNLYKAILIRDSLTNKDGLISSYLHLSEYYTFKKDTFKAKNYALKANSLAREIKNNRDYLLSLQKLAALDVDKSYTYLKKYIVFKDSLQVANRKIQNKFTRISFETNEYIAKTASLSEQKKWIFIIGLSILFISFSLYYLKIQRTLKEKLILEAEQQKANEKVYLLTIKQQAKLEEEKIKERNRISEELHDGILSKLFGTRLGLGFLDIEGDKNTKQKHQLFLEELQLIEKEIREVSHKLHDNFDDSNFSFMTILKKLLETRSKIGKFNFQINDKDITDWYLINEIIKVNLYRIIEEAIQNITKYAQAENVEIRFSNKKNNLKLTIIDDGIGFNLNKKKKGIGLKNIKSRVEKLKGLFTIESKLNDGTIIKIQIPEKLVG